MQTTPGPSVRSTIASSAGRMIAIPSPPSLRSVSGHTCRAHSQRSSYLDIALLFLSSTA